MWERMLKVMGYSDLAEDPEYAAPMFATDKAEIRMELLHLWCEERPVKDVEDALVGADIPVGIDGHKGRWASWGGKEVPMEDVWFVAITTVTRIP